MNIRRRMMKLKMNTVQCLVVLIFYTFWVPLGRTLDLCEDVKTYAKTIVDSHFSELTVAEIITKLTPEQCRQLNKEVANINGGVPLIDEKYVPYKDTGSVYKDLLYALLSDPTVVLAKYLGEFMHHKDEKLITVIMLQVTDMSHFIEIYNRVQGDGFEDDRNEQKKPFRGLLRVWAQTNRETDESLPSGQECEDIKVKMYDEQPFWCTTRNLLEKILIKKSCAYSAAVLKVYEKRHVGYDIEDDLFHVLTDKDLCFAYQCLAGYVKDKFKLWAKLLHQFRDTGDRYAVWITIVSINRGQNIAKINEVFKRDFGGESLCDFILKKKGDPTVIEILAKLVDSNHKLNIAAAPPPGTSGAVTTQ